MTTAIHMSPFQSAHVQRAPECSNCGARVQPGQPCDFCGVECRSDSMLELTALMVETEMLFDMEPGGVMTASNADARMKRILDAQSEELEAWKAPQAVSQWHNPTMPTEEEIYNHFCPAPSKPFFRLSNFIVFVLVLLFLMFSVSFLFGDGGSDISNNFVDFWLIPILRAIM